MRSIVLALSCLLAPACWAAVVHGVVSHVTDGDTVWVRPASGGPPLHVRIEGIDAPEKCQAFGAESRAALADFVLHQRVSLATHGADDYRRTVGRLKRGREDVGAWMVAHGYAWSYRFRSDTGPYARQERQARQARLGLWRDGSPELPREFRVRHGPCAATMQR